MDFDIITEDMKSKTSLYVRTSETMTHNSPEQIPRNTQIF